MKHSYVPNKTSQQNPRKKTQLANCNIKWKTRTKQATVKSTIHTSRPAVSFEYIPSRYRIVTQLSISTQQHRPFQLKPYTLAQIRALLLCFHFTLEAEGVNSRARVKCSFFWMPERHSGSLSHSTQTDHNITLYQGTHSRGLESSTNNGICKVVVEEKHTIPERPSLCSHHKISCHKLHFISISSLGTHHIADVCLSPTGQVALTRLTQNRELLHGCFDTSQVVPQTCECSVMPLRYSHDYKFHTLHREINRLVHPFILDRSKFEALSWKQCRHQEASTTRQLFQMHNLEGSCSVNA
jgi:hypothetical protein